MLRRAMAGDRRWRGAVLEVAVVVAVLAVNLVVRWATLDDTDAAVRNARDVLALEARWGLDREAALQAGSMAVPGLTELASGFYVGGYLPLLAAALVWSFVRRPAAYPVLRNALLASGVVGFAVYLFYPCAPPRMLAVGYVDTLAGTSPALDAAAHPAGLSNEIAALPSFHVGWVVVVAVVLFTSTRSFPLRVACVAYPVAMGYAVVVTGNHWVLDLPAGLAMATFGLVIAKLGPRARRATDRPHGPDIRRIAGRWRPQRPGSAGTS